MTTTKPAVTSLLFILASAFSMSVMAADVPCKTFVIAGECAPPAHTRDVVVSENMSKALYYRCKDLEAGLKRPGDEYTKQCCDHLSGALQDSEKVCRAQPPTPLWKFITFTAH